MPALYLGNRRGLPLQGTIMAKKKISQEEAYHLGTDYQFGGSVDLGPWTTYSLLNDPKHLGFVLAR